MNNKKYYIGGGLIIIAGILVGGYLFEGLYGTPTVTAPTQSSSTTSAATSTALASLDPLNTTYSVDGTSITLVNGKASVAAAPGSAETITTQTFGQPVLGDLNGDGTNDAAIILVQTGAGSGSFFYIATALATNNGTVGTNAVLLGDRIAPDTTQVANGIVTVNYADRKSTDSMTTQPSIGVSKYLVVAGTALYDTPSDIYPLPSGFTWNATHEATVSPANEHVPSTLVGVEAVSQPIANITDLTAHTAPFDKYYKAKLTAAGWTVDNSLAAGGPGAEIVGYKKGSSYIILKYTSVFQNDGGGVSPESCPCDMTFSVFAGTLEK
jgi:hypothetical protein